METHSKNVLRGKVNLMFQRDLFATFLNAEFKRVLNIRVFCDVFGATCCEYFLGGSLSKWQFLERNVLAKPI